MRDELFLAESDSVAFSLSEKSLFEVLRGTAGEAEVTVTLGVELGVEDAVSGFGIKT